MNLGRLTYCLGVVLVGTMLPSFALAYIGPGAGLSAIGTLLAVVGAAILLIVGFVWYPVKRMLRWFKAKRNADAGKTVDSNS